MKKKRILVIDDEKDLVETLRFPLETNGYEVIAAYDAPSALDKIKENPDLVLLDIYLPGTDGLELLRRLKEAPKTKSIPVVVLTCSKDSEVLTKATKLGVASYLEKPVEDAELFKAIEKNIGE